MSTYTRTEGICLRRLDFSNTSQVATFLTPDRGKLSFLAKGVLRAPKRGIRSGFELAGHYELIFTELHTGSLHNLTQFSLLNPHRQVRSTIERILCAYYAAELVLEFAAEAEPCPRLYDRLVSSLDRFERGQNLGFSVLQLEIGALHEQGICPVLDACAECEAKLPDKTRLLFSPEHGGALCPECARALPPRFQTQGAPVHARRLALLRELSRVPPPSIEQASYEPGEIVAASRLLRFHMRYLLGKELRMWKYLQDRHLSRSLRRFRERAGVA